MLTTTLQQCIDPIYVKAHSQCIEWLCSFVAVGADYSEQSVQSKMSRAFYRLLTNVDSFANFYSDQSADAELGVSIASLVCLATAMALADVILQ